MYYEHNKDRFLIQYITQKLVKNRSQNIVNYILKTVWLCTTGCPILNAEQTLGLQTETLTHCYLLVLSSLRMFLNI